MKLPSLRRFLVAGMAAFTAVLSACSTDGTQPPFSPEDQPNATMVFASENDPRLQAWLSREKARVEQKTRDNQALQNWLRHDATKRVVTSDVGVSLFACEPQPYRAQTKVVGPDGGNIGFGDHTLKIPAGALSGWTVITAEAPTIAAVQAVLSPHGLRFQKDVQLHLSYKACVPPSFSIVKFTVYVNDALQVLELPPSKDDKVGKKVDTSIRHFSSYMVAY